MHQTFYLAGPRCRLQLLYVPALDLTAAPPNSTNPSIFFHLTFHNVLKHHRVYYSDVNLTFYYGYSHKAIANYTIAGFHQGSSKTAGRRDVVETSGVPWQDAVEAVSTGSKVVFRLELAAWPRFRILFWVTNPKKVNIAAEVEVDGDGVNAVKDGIRLTSYASSNRGGIRVFVGFFGVLFVNLLMC